MESNYAQERVGTSESEFGFIRSRSGGEYWKAIGQGVTSRRGEAVVYSRAQYEALAPYFRERARFEPLPGPEGVKRTAKSGDWLASLTSAERKECAMSRGLFAYFPDALAAISRHSFRMNEKHNPGEPIHWSRDKSKDHPDCELRHALAIAVNPDATDDGQPEMVCKAWRALAELQVWIEGKVARGEKF